MSKDPLQQLVMSGEKLAKLPLLKRVEKPTQRREYKRKTTIAKPLSGDTPAKALQRYRSDGFGKSGTTSARTAYVRYLALFRGKQS